ncbi:phosphopantetheine-binding protein [Streptomyces sp. NPDC057798]|uniref:phosphopantetheine-binding protein n=1 Tax=Streptomyces sp. NPDC057798 TaxID=3346252 RepID=UPI003689E32C
MESPALPHHFVSLLQELFEVTSDQLLPSATFDSLDIDSLALMELLAAAEDEYGLVPSQAARDLTPASTMDEAAAALSDSMLGQ